MPEGLVKHGIGAALSILVGVGIWYGLEHGLDGLEEKVRAESELIAIFIGGFVEVIYLVVLESVEYNRRFRELFKLHEETSRKQNSLTRDVGAYLQKQEKLGFMLSHHGLDMTREETAKTWITLLTETRQSYYATNYISPDEIYKTNWAKAALLIQNAKKTVNAPQFVIKKVFFTEKDQEISKLSAYLAEQKQAGVDIHYIPFDQFMNADLKENINNGYYESIDFGIFDERIVLIWKLNGRTLVGGRLLFSDEDSQKYIGLFNELFEKAAAYNANRIILVSLDKATRELIAKWPDYGAPYEEMNYAIHSQTAGWLATFGLKSKNFAAYDDGDLIGFSMLDCDTKGDAEFYVAIHPDKVNKSKQSKQKYGTRLTEQTLLKAFQEIGLRKVHLKVRTDLQHRINMYESVGFVSRKPNETIAINGKDVEFKLMEITKDEHAARHGR